MRPHLRAATAGRAGVCTHLPPAATLWPAPRVKVRCAREVGEALHRNKPTRRGLMGKVQRDPEPAGHRLGSKLLRRPDDIRVERACRTGASVGTGAVGAASLCAPPQSSPALASL